MLGNRRFAVAFLFLGMAGNRTAKLASWFQFLSAAARMAQLA